MQTSKTPSAAVGVAAGDELLLTCDREPRGSRPVVRRADPAASHSRSHCVGASCCSDPRRVESSGVHRPALTDQCPDALPLERLMPAFDLPVRLRVKQRNAHVRHPRDRMNSLKSRAMNCGPLSEIIRGLASGTFPWLVPESSQCRLPHRLPQIPMHQKTTVSIQHTA